MQTLPWNMRGWHCGTGSRGSANNTHISFEICEDSLENSDYLESVYQAAVELTAELCSQYGLDPEADGVVLCHSEGHARGIASNHADVMHWFPKFDKNMDTFRADVARALRGEDEMDERSRYGPQSGRNWPPRRPKGRRSGGRLASPTSRRRSRPVFWTV